VSAPEKEMAFKVYYDYFFATSTSIFKKILKDIPRILHNFYEKEKLAFRIITVRKTVRKLFNSVSILISNSGTFVKYFGRVITRPISTFIY